MSTAADHKAHMLAQLARLRRLRGPDALPDALARNQKVLVVQAFQRLRLHNTYADLLASARYHPAATFFLDDLYGTRDMSPRDADLLRILPVMSRVLPAKGVETVGFALEMDAISLEMDHALAANVTGEKSLSADGYLAAYRAAGGNEARMRQIALIHEVGERLQHLVQMPLIYATLKLMRRPAHLAGLGELQEFLERGAAAFKHMNGSDEFLNIIRERESEIHRRIMARASEPFAWA